MKKYLAGYLLVLLALLLTGCDKLTQLSLSEQQVNQYLTKHVKFEKELNVSGIAKANIKLEQLNAEIGRHEPNKIALSAIITLNIESVFGNQITTMDTTLTAQPYLATDNGAIYLKDMQITQYKITPDNAATAVKIMMPYLNSSLNEYFNQTPVYTLSENNSETEALAKKLAKGIEIKPGKIIIPFTD